MHLGQCATAEKVKGTLRFKRHSTMQTSIQRVQKPVERFPVKITCINNRELPVNNIRSALFSQLLRYYCDHFCTKYISKVVFIFTFLVVLLDKLKSAISEYKSCQTGELLQLYNIQHQEKVKHIHMMAYN